MSKTSFHVNIHHINEKEKERDLTRGIPLFQLKPHLSICA
jgi:hypothetical protein